MTEPTYDATTERVYARLPEFYRTMDEQVDWQFKKFVSATVTSLFDIDRLTARIEYIPPENRVDYYEALDAYSTYTRPDGIEDPDIGYDPIGETSDLIDGRTADAEWLPYIAQLIGADISRLYTLADQRDAVVRNYLGFRAGSREALENAVKQALTGDKYVRVYPHRDGAGQSFDSIGTEWDVLIVTKSSETPSFQNIVDEVQRKGAKPAGVVLHHLTYTLSWDQLNDEGAPATGLFLTWASLETDGGNWTNIELGNADLLPL